MAGMPRPKAPVRSLELDDPTLKVRVSLSRYDPTKRGYVYNTRTSARFSLARHSDADRIWTQIVSLLRQLHEPDDDDRPPRPGGRRTMGEPVGSPPPTA